MPLPKLACKEYEVCMYVCVYIYIYIGVRICPSQSLYCIKHIESEDHPLKPDSTNKRAK
jgi:hypothetical protein